MRRTALLGAAWLLAAAAASSTPLVGGDADANGCIASAGYTFCKPLGKCIRSWESSCVALEETTEGGDGDKNEKEGKEEDGEEAEEEEEEERVLKLHIIVLTVVA